MERQKRMAVIQDISGFGRCSLTVALPVISATGIQCCPLITAVLSNHTGYSTWFFDDYTDRMPAYIDQWKKLELTFDGIYTGFLGSQKQIQIVKDFIQEFKGPETKIIVDPVMGDKGRVYATYTEELCRDMTKLAGMGQILTPNITELCLLTGTPYGNGHFSQAALQKMAEQLSASGPEKIVITGITQGGYIANGIYEKGHPFEIFRTRIAGKSRCGTGDLFSSIIAADAVNGVEFSKSVEKASLFVKKCVIRSQELDIPMTDGVCFEEFLHLLSGTEIEQIKDLE